jgi:hypothetical protein
MSITMGNYILWCRRTTDPEALWADMPYAQRSYEDCVELQAHYEEQWGTHYEYEIHRTGIAATYPKGTRQPCFVVNN